MYKTGKIQWIPEHYGIVGNENPDCFAKQGWNFMKTHILLLSKNPRPQKNEKQRTTPTANKNIRKIMERFHKKMFRILQEE